MNSSWIDRLERHLGFLAAPGLASFITGMTVICGLLSTFKPEFIDLLSLNPLALATGQLWRMITFLFVPPPSGPLLLILWIMMLYSILSALEAGWGDFKFTFFIVLGLVATTIGSILTGSEFENTYIILATFLAFARLMPEREVLVLFVLPVKLRWLAVLAALWAGLDFMTNGTASRLRITTGLLPYFVFFGPEHWNEFHWAYRRWRYKK